MFGCTLNPPSLNQSEHYSSEAKVTSLAQLVDNLAKSMVSITERVEEVERVNA